MEFIENYVNLLLTNTAFLFWTVVFFGSTIFGIILGNKEITREESYMIVNDINGRRLELATTAPHVVRSIPLFFKASVLCFLLMAVLMMGTEIFINLAANVFIQYIIFFGVCALNVYKTKNKILEAHVKEQDDIKQEWREYKEMKKMEELERKELESDTGIVY